MTFASGSRLASLSPAATTDTLAFTATVETEITRIFVANRSGGAITFRIYHVAAGETLAATDALFHDVSVAAGAVNDIVSHAEGGGIHMEPDDTLHVRASAVNMNFNIYGVTSDVAKV